MSIAGMCRSQATPLDRLILATPCLWRHHPFLPVVRRLAGGSRVQCGVVYDAPDRTSGPATVYLTNLFALPATVAGLLARPQCVYESLDALANDGWVID